MIVVHARACLRAALGRPLALVFTLAVPTVLLALLPLFDALPLAVAAMLTASTGGLGMGMVEGLLARTERWPNTTGTGPALLTLPLSPRQRAVAETLAVALLLLAGTVVAEFVFRLLLQPWISEVSLGQISAVPPIPLSAAVALIVPATLGGCMQQGGGSAPQLLAIALPGASAVVAWRMGLITELTPFLLFGGAWCVFILAIGPVRVPRLSLPAWHLPPLARAPAPPTRTLSRDFRRGLLTAHLQAAPLASLAILPWLVGGRAASLGPTFYGAVAVFMVAIGAAMCPLGHTPLGRGRGTPFDLLPLPRHQIARVLYGHAFVCALALPVAYLLLLRITGELSGIAAPLLVLLGVPLAPVAAAALTGFWLRGWRRAGAAMTAGLAIAVLMRVALASPSALPLTGLLVASLLAGLLPVADLLRRRPLAPA